MGRGRGSWRKVVKRGKLPAIREISSKDVIYNMITRVNTTV